MSKGAKVTHRRYGHGAIVRVHANGRTARVAFDDGLILNVLLEDLAS